MSELEKIVGPAACKSAGASAKKGAKIAEAARTAGRYGGQNYLGSRGGKTGGTARAGRAATPKNGIVGNR